MEPVYLLALGAAFTFLATAFWKWRAQVQADQAKEKERVDKLIAAQGERVDKLSEDMTLIKMQFSPFWKTVESRIIADLTHPSPQFVEMDELLKKLELLTITEDERARLAVMLRERMHTSDPEVTPEERASAAVLLVVMDKVIAESAESN